MFRSEGLKNLSPAAPFVIKPQGATLQVAPFVFILTLHLPNLWA